MNSILELDVQNEQAAALAMPYSSAEDRKEIYLKYLIVTALQKYSSYVYMADSLFYGRKFYSATRVFDFYVNNNLFDLIILQPSTNKLLFKVRQNDFHANIFGYVVARIDENARNAKILGYFCAKDYKEVVKYGGVKLSELKPVEEFSDIDIMETPLSLEDVSERFFALLSAFCDDNISDEDFSELACLLYNSAELRGVFSELGRFEKICSDMKTNSSLLEDDMMSVLASRKEKLDETDEAYNLDDLTLLANDTQAPKSVEASIEPADIANAAAGLSALGAAQAAAGMAAVGGASVGAAGITAAAEAANLAGDVVEGVVSGVDSLVSDDAPQANNELQAKLSQLQDEPTYDEEVEEDVVDDTQTDLSDDNILDLDAISDEDVTVEEPSFDALDELSAESQDDEVSALVQNVDEELGVEDDLSLSDEDDLSLFDEENEQDDTQDDANEQAQDDVEELDAAQDELDGLDELDNLGEDELGSEELDAHDELVEDVELEVTDSASELEEINETAEQDLDANLATDNIESLEEVSLIEFDSDDLESTPTEEPIAQPTSSLSRFADELSKLKNKPVTEEPVIVEDELSEDELGVDDSAIVSEDEASIVDEVDDLYAMVEEEVDSLTKSVDESVSAVTAEEEATLGVDTKSAESANNTAASDIDIDDVPFDADMLDELETMAFEEDIAKSISEQAPKAEHTDEYDILLEEVKPSQVVTEEKENAKAGEVEADNANNVSSTQEAEVKEPTEAEETPTAKQEAKAVDIDSELLDLLSSEDDTISENVDDSEIYSILGVSPEEKSKLQQQPEQKSVIEEKPVVEPQVEVAELDAQQLQPQQFTQAVSGTIPIGMNIKGGAEKEIGSEEVSAPIPMIENEDLTAEDLASLYTGEDSEGDASFPGIGIVNSDAKTVAQAKKIYVTVCVLALLVCAGITCFGLKSFLANNNSNSGSNDSAVSQNVQNDDFNAPVPDNNIDMAPTPSVDANVDLAPVLPPVQTASRPATQDTKIVSSLSKQAGAAPVILKSVAWQVPSSVANDVVFNKYLQIAGKNIKMNLASDLLDSDDFAYNNVMKVSMKVRNNTPVKDIKIVESSGSESVNQIVLRSIKQTLKYINSPVMSSGSEEREVILVISL